MKPVNVGYSVPPGGCYQLSSSEETAEWVRQQPGEGYDEQFIWDAPEATGVVRIYRDGGQLRPEYEVEGLRRGTVVRMKGSLLRILGTT